MVEPFLKWAGGKRWLASSDAMPRPVAYERYIEPFLGGGAVFFRLSPQKALLSDLNSELIDLYTAIKDDPERIRRQLETHHKLHCKDYYYAVRRCVPNDRFERAGRTLYLNRTCWNGLYRVNLRGDFNVPIGTKDSVLTEGDNFQEISNRLQSADIRNCDFQESIELAGAGDFLFVDPPYTVKHNMNGFVKYNETIFSWADQVRLQKAVRAAADRGASVVVTNADHESLRELYVGCFEYRTLSRKSVLSSKAAARGATTEAMFLANI